MIKSDFEKAKAKLEELTKAWGKSDIYMVGGCVRDLQLHEPIKDIDLCVDYPNGGVEFVKYLEKEWSGCCRDFVTYPRFGTSKFTLDLGGRERNPNMKIVLDIECVMPRTETYNQGPRKPDSVDYTSITEDAKRRDFCCNALYLSLKTGKILDPTGHGLEDIKNKILRTPLDAEKTFIDDPLRMLRAFRFASTKDFTILPEVLEKIKDYPEYYKLSMERVRDEFSKILCSPYCVSAIKDLHDHHLLKYIIPNLEDAWGFNQNSKYHSMNLTDHIFAVLTGVLRERRDLSVRWAALLHDISKYRDFQIKEDGGFSFHQHEISSAKMSMDILRRLKYPEELVEKVALYIRGHMCIKSLYNRTTDSYTGKPKKTRALARTYGPELKNIMILIDADNKAHAPAWNQPGQVKSFWEAYKRDVTNYVPAQQGKKLNQPVDGKEIMSTLGIPGGKVIGIIKNIFQDWYDSDASLTKEQLFTMYKMEYNPAKKFWAKRYSFMDTELTFQDPGTIQQKNWEVPLSISEDEYTFPKDHEGDIIELDAFHYPQLYKRLLIHKEARKIIDEIGDAMDKFFNLPGFDGCEFTMDSGRDFSGYINWKGYKREGIL